MKLIRAFVLGVRTWRECVEGGSGYSYPDHRLSEAYDRGVNFGQNVSTIATIVSHPLTQHSED